MPPPTSNAHHPLLVWARKHDLATVTAVANMLGISQSRLSQIINRKHRPTANLILRIHKATGIPLDALLDITPAEVKAGIKAGWEKPKAKAKRKPRG